ISFPTSLGESPSGMEGSLTRHHRRRGIVSTAEARRYAPRARDRSRSKTATRSALVTASVEGGHADGLGLPEHERVSVTTALPRGLRGAPCLNAKGPQMRAFR